MTTLPPPIHAVFFDLGGTLLHPVSVAEVYSRTGRDYGSTLAAEGLRERFLDAFLRQEEIDRTLNWKTDAERERQRWHAIVREVLHDLQDFEGCFNALYDFYAFPTGWTMDPDVPELLDMFVRDGVQLGVASNFDHRLHGLVRAFPELNPLTHLIVSVDIGHRKPSPRFFEAVVNAVCMKPENILLVGDDFVNDYQGAVSAGLQAVLLDPKRKHRNDKVRRVDRLAEVTGRVSDTPKGRIG